MVSNTDILADDPGLITAVASTVAKLAFIGAVSVAAAPLLGVSFGVTFLAGLATAAIANGLQARDLNAMYVAGTLLPRSRLGFTCTCCENL